MPLFQAACGAQPVNTVAIRTEHPRLILTPELIAQLQAKRTGSAAQRAQWESMVSYTNSWLANNHIGASTIAALLSRLDPTLKKDGVNYGTLACQYAAHHVDTQKTPLNGLLDTPAKIRSGNSFRWYAPSVAMIYDWAYHQCSEESKKTIEEFFDSVWTTHGGGVKMLQASTYRVANNIGMGIIRGSMLVSIAGYDPTDRRQHEERLQTMVDLVRQLALPCLNSWTVGTATTTCAGGSWPEGIEYAPETKMIYWELMESLRTGTVNTDLFSEAPEFARESASFHIASTSPASRPVGASNSYEPFPYRDVQHPGILWMTDRSLMVRLGTHFRRLGDTRTAGHIQWWLNNVQPYYVMSSKSAATAGIQDFLYHDPDYPEIDYRAPGGASTNWITPFMLLSRADWKASATWVGLMAMMEGGDHMHGDTGQLQIMRKGRWLTREVVGYMGGPATLWAQSSHSHSVPILNFHGSRSSSVRRNTSGTFAHLTSTADGGILAECAKDDTWCYAQADMTASYRFSGYRNTPDVDNYGAVRDLLYLKPDLMVVADRYKYVDGLEAPSVSLLQALEKPTVAGNLATLPSGDQRLHVTVAIPENPVINIVNHSRTVRVFGARKVNDDQVDIFVDGYNPLTDGKEVTISGAAGNWGAINGTWTVKLPDGPTQAFYQDGLGYNGERFRISGDKAFSAIESLWNLREQTDVELNIPKDIKISGVPFEAWRIEISSGEYVNEEAQLLVLEAADEGKQPIPVSRCTTDGINAIQFANYTVAAVRTRWIPEAFSYTCSGGSPQTTHFVIGLIPKTNYEVSVDTDGGVSVKLGSPTTPPAAAAAPPPGQEVRIYQTTASGLLILPGSADKN